MGHDLDDDELRKTRISKGLEEKNADEMFEEVGYRKVKDDEEMCVYEANFHYDLDFKKMRFIKEHQQIDLYGNMIYTTLYLEELQAIYKKCSELGWIKNESRYI